MQEYNGLVMPDNHRLAGATEAMYIEGPNETRALLSNRTFGDARITDQPNSTQDVDYWTGNAISGSIEFLIEGKKQDATLENSRVRVLDIGSGYQAQPAAMLKAQYREAVDVFAIDLVYDASSLSDDISVAMADAARLPFSDDSMDVVMSFQCIPYLGDAKQTAIDEIIRVLSVGGAAVIDAFHGIPLVDRWYEDFLKERGSSGGPYFANFDLNGQTRIHLDLWDAIPAADPGWNHGGGPDRPMLVAFKSNGSSAEYLDLFTAIRERHEHIKTKLGVETVW